MANIAGAFLEACERHGPSEAFIDGHQRLSFRDAGHRAVAVAARLQARGAMPGDRIAIALPNGVEHALSYFGAQLAGAIVVLVNTRLATPELAHVLVDSGARIIVTDASLLPRLPVGHGAVVVQAQELTAAALEPGRDEESAEEALPGLERAAGDVAQLLYTSGTTGHPKGAMQTHANLLFNAGSVRDLIGAGPGQRTLVVAPMFHATGIASQLLGFVLHGGACVFMPAFIVDDALRLMVEERITVFAGVAAMLRLLLDRAALQDADLSALRLFVMGGSPVPESFPGRVLERVPTLNLANVWGLTEATSIVTYVEGREYVEHAWSVGRAVDGVELAVAVDGGAPQDVRGRSGELCVRGPLVMAGYWNNAPATAATYVDGWLHTGDVGSIDESGLVRVFDRLKDMIIRGGENIYSLEVETVLAAHPDVADVAVVGVPDPVLDERVRAVVVLQPGSVCAADALRSFAADRLADYKVPVEYVFLSELPRNASGKVLKRALSDLSPQHNGGARSVR